MPVPESVLEMRGKGEVELMTVTAGTSQPDLWDYHLMSDSVRIQRGECLICHQSAKIEFWCWRCWGYVE